MYQEIVRTDTEPWCWWKFAKKNPGYTKKCAKLLRLAIGASLHENDVSRDMCHACGDSVTSKGAHVLFSCCTLEGYRDMWRNNVCSSMPEALVREFDRMNVDERFLFIVNGLNDSMIGEWSEMYKGILLYVDRMYSEYVEVLEVLV